MEDYSTHTDEQLRNEHDRLLRIQRNELEAGNHERARETARERQAVWKEAAKRGVDLEADDG
jgi:hypothetical protein